MVLEVQGTDEVISRFRVYKVLSCETLSYIFVLATHTRKRSKGESGGHGGWSIE